jgi:DNA-binding response OmpR family regulator
MQHAADRNRVLLIEDDPWVQSVLAELLRDEGYAVSRATTGGEGLRLAEQTRPAVILLDLHLPDTPGIQMLRRLKERAATRETPVLVVSAHADLLEQCQNCADGVHSKPFDVGALLAHIQYLVRTPSTATSSRSTPKPVAPDAPR